ncbi:MAG TPA: redoxin family protein [Planctomycetaceae bacterium]|nr:redoxin family protein [Planctomycetaceae bacterium]
MRCWTIGILTNSATDLDSFPENRETETAGTLPGFYKDSRDRPAEVRRARRLSFRADFLKFPLRMGMNVKRLWILVLVLGGGVAARADVPEGDAGAAVRQAPRVLNPKDRNISRLVPNVEFQDVAGKRHQLGELAKSKGLLVAVTSTSCPLSRKYFPTLVQLAKQYSADGFAVVLVNPIATDKPEAIREAASELGAQGIYVHDAKGELCRALQLTSTTDAVLVDPARTVRYHGAVDDQYGFGYSMAAPRKTYLATALAEYRKGLPIAIAATEAPGCVLDEHKAPARPAAAVTYHNRISRIVQAHCGECHRDGGVGPFSLETREDLASHAAMIATVVKRGTMPPWFASAGPQGAPSPWVDDCSLNAADKDDLLAWLDGDRAEGDPRDAPLPVQYASGWTIGKPDLVARFPAPIPIQATGVMRYQDVAVDLDLNEDKWVERIEIRPGAPQVVHHILVFVRPPRGGAPAGRGANEDGISYWGIYVPGNSKQVYPKGFARKLPKGSRLHFQIHYTPNGTATEDLTQIGFVFAEREPENEVKTASLVNTWFEIPPGADNYTDSAKVKLPADVTVLGFLPHMHLRGKSCSYEALTADGKRETVLDIPRYDFNWQLLYRYAEPRTFKKGTVLKFNATFDNSAANPANPDPKLTVRWGEQTYDEMIVGYVEYFVPVGATGEQLADAAIGQSGLAGDRDQMLFASLDANDDDRLSLDEVRKLTENPRMKVNPVTIGVVFATLDKDKDGFLSLEEFRKLRDVFRKNRGAEGRGPG